jgi:PAS domain S-box-containing protein
MTPFKNSLNIFFKKIILDVNTKSYKSYKSAVITILIAAALLVSFSIVNFIKEYRNIQVTTKSRAKVVANLGSLAVQEPLWDLDIESIDKTLTSLFYDNEVNFVEIKSSNGETLFQKNSNNPKISNKYNVFVEEQIIKNDLTSSGYKIDNQNLGIIKVGVTKYFKQQELIQNLVIGLIFVLVILFLVSISIISILSQEKNNQERIKTILDNMADSVITTDTNLVVKTCNLSTEKMFGYKSKDVIGKPLQQLILVDKSITDDWNETVDKYYSASIAQNINGLKQNGDLFPVEFNLGTIALNDEKLFLLSIRDITIRNEVNKMKDEFVSVVSHELRTPLTSIIASLKLVSNNLLGEIPEKAKHMLDIALNSSNDLLSLINNILDIDKINNKKVSINFETLDVNSLIAQLIKNNTMYANQYKVSLCYESNNEELNVKADKEKLSLVITNLLSNAAKFSPENSEVKVFTKKMDNILRISVVDKGPGIGDEHKEFVFNKFTQIDSALNRKKGGSGLGLYISKIFIELMNGQLALNSVLGEGSEFYIDLPLV